MSPIQILNGVIADTPTKLTDKIKVSVPDLQTMSRQVYGPLPFDPIVSGRGGTRLPQAGDSAIVGVDEGTGRQWVIGWHRDDTTLPPYSEEGLGTDDRGGLLEGQARMTVHEGKSFTQNIVPLSRGFDPAYLGIFGSTIDLSLYGAPATGKILWPDGTYGKFVAITI